MSIFDKQDIDPQTGLNIEQKDNSIFSRSRRTQPDLTPTQAGAYGVGQYFRDENLNLQDVVDAPEELNYNRANMQTGWELLGKSLAQGGIEATLGAAEGIAYALDFEEIFNHDKQASEGFDNWAAKGIRGFKENLQDDYFKIYQTRDAESGSLLDKMGDGTWWASQGKTMGTTLSLMFPAMGVAGIAGKIGKGINLASKIGKATAIGEAAAQAGLQGTAAALFSRKAESAMEANQKFQEDYQMHLQDPKTQMEALQPFKQEFDQITSEYDQLSKTLYNPSQENYQLLEGQRQQKLSELQGRMSQIKQTAIGNVDELAKKKAGEAASKVFKANAAMLPIDILQYSLLLKPLSGLKKTADTFGKSVLGKTASILAIQPASEAVEEGYQFVASEEATESVRTGEKMFGEGFGNRMSEYVKDPAFHESVFLGGAMGLLFEGAGPVARTAAERTAKYANALNSTRVAKDPNKTAKVASENRKDFITKSLINDNVDRNREDFKKVVETAKNNKDLTNEQRDEIVKNAETIIGDLDDVQKWESELISNEKFSENNQLRNQYVLAKLADKHVKENISKYKQAYNQELGKVELPDLTPVGENTKEHLNALRNELIDAQIYKNSLEHTINVTNNSDNKELNEKQRASLTSYLNKQLEAAKVVVENKTKELESKSGDFSQSKLAPANLEQLQEAKNYLTENQVKNQFIVAPTLSQFQKLTKEEATAKEKSLINTIAQEGNKTIESEIKTKLNRDLPLEYYEQLESELKDTKISESTKKTLQNKIKQLRIKKEAEIIKSSKNNEIPLPEEPVNKMDLSNVPEEQNTEFDFEGNDVEEAGNNSAISKNPEVVAFAEDISNGVVRNTPGDQQFYKNNSNDVEGELQRLQFVKNSIPKELTPETNAEDIVVETEENKEESTDIITQELPEEQTIEEEELESEESNSDYSFGIARVKQYDVNSDGKKTDSYDKDGNLIITDRNLLESSIPGKFAKGNKVILAVDMAFIEGNNNKDYLPIAIQTIEDHAAGKKPILWLRAKNPSKSDIAIRKYMFSQVNKTKKPNFSFTAETTIDQHLPAWINKTRQERPIAEQLIDGKTNNAHIAIGNHAMTVKTVDNNGNHIIAEDVRKFQPGTSYIMIKNSDSKWYAHKIYQKPISNERFDRIRAEWILNAHQMIIEFAKGNKIFEDIEDLRHEVSKYLNLNPAVFKDKKASIKLATKEGKFNNFFGIGQEANGDIELQLPGHMDGGKSYPYLKFTIKNVNGKLSIEKYIGKDDDVASYAKISQTELLKEFELRLTNMYPNIKEITDPELRNNFTRLQVTKEGLKRTEPQHYYQFLSDNKIAETRINGLKTPSGEVVFTTTPRIAINSNINSFTEVKKDLVEEVKKPEVSNKDLPIEPQNSFFNNMDNDFEEPVVPVSDDLVSQIDFNKASLKSFKANNDIVNTLHTNVLKILDAQKARTGYNNLYKAVAQVKADLEFARDNYNKFIDANLTPEEAAKNGVTTLGSRNQAIAETMTNILDNFEEKRNSDGNIDFIGYSEFINLKIDESSYEILSATDDEYEENSDEGEKNSDTEAYAVNRAFKEDPEKSMDAKVRRLFYDIPLRNNKRQKVPNQIWQPIYIDSGVVFNYLIDQLVGTNPDEIMDEMRQLAEYNDIAKDVLDKLDKLAQTNPDVVKSFIVTMTKQQANFMTLKYIFSKDAEYLPTVKIIHTNRSGISDVLASTWEEVLNYDLNSSNDFETINGNVKISVKKREELVKKYNAIGKDDLKGDFIASMASIGVKFSERAYDQLQKDFEKKRKPFIRRFGGTAQGSSFKKFLDNAFGPIFNDAIAKGDSPYRDQSAAIKNLAFYQSKFETDATSRMHRNSNGDSVYSYVTPSHMSRILNDLKNNPAKVEELMMDKFSGKSTILKDIQKYNQLKALPILDGNQQVELERLSEEIKSLGVVYFDASKNDVSGAFPRNYEKQSIVERELTKISLYINNGSNISQIFTPTPSDKTMFTLFQSLRINTRSIVLADGQLKITGKEKYKSEANPIINKLKDLLVQSEIDRINHVSMLFSQAVKNKDFSNLIEGYHYIKVGKDYKPGAGTYFFFIPELNKVVNEQNIRNQETGELSVDFADSKVVKQVMLSGIQSLVKEKLAIWERIGITKDGIFKSVDKSVLEKYGKDPSNLAISYVINSMSVLANEYMLITNDPARFGKTDDYSGNYEDYEQLLESTSANMFKRIAKDIAPGTQAEWEVNHYRVMMIAEPKFASELASYNETFKKAYGDIKLADAQEWTTLEEHINVLKAYGEITNEEYDDILKNKENLSDTQIEIILQPMKPVQVFNVFEADLKENIPYYIKSSSFPLIPQIAKQFPQLNRMMQIMYKNDIQRVAPKSATKTGYRNAVDLTSTKDFEKDGITLKKNKRTGLDKAITLSRDGFRIQQKFPYDLEKETDLEGSQLRRLLTANMIDTDGNALVFDLNGKQKSGLELKELNDEIHTELYNRRFNDLLEKLSANETVNGITLNDVNELRKLMVEEAVNKEYGYNEILALRTVEFNGKNTFETPLFFHPMIHKIESILTSIMKNRVLKLKLPGKSSVQGSPYGFVTTLEEFNKTIGKNNVIIYSKDYDATKGLSYKKNADGSIEAEIFLPIPFKKNGKPVNTSEYTKDGYIDLTKLSPQMLEMIGYRIPTQKASSMMRLKVAGFLPQTVGDLIITPPELYAQMGTDNDGDKLKLHWYNYNIASTGKIQKIAIGSVVKDMSNEQLQNLSIDIMHSVMRHPEIVNRTINPLENKDIQNVVDALDKAKGKKTSTNKMGLSVINDNMQSDMVAIQAAGKAGIAIESVAVTMHALGQYAGLYITANPNRSTSVKFSNTDETAGEFTDKAEGNTVDDSLNYEHPQSEGAWRLDKIFGFDGKMISDVLVNIQNESVDNANNRLLFPMNLNEVTFDVANLIARAGFNERFIGFFLNQPIILEYVEELNKLNRFDEKNFTPNKVKQLQLRMLNSVGAKIEFDDLNDLSTSNLSMAAMEAGLTDKNKETQLKALTNFIIYNDISKDLNKIQRTANVDNKFLGSNLNGVVSKLKNFESDIKGTYIGNGENLHVGRYGDTTQGSAYKMGIEKSVKLYSNILPINTNLINNLYEQLVEQAGRELSEDELLDFNIGIRNAIYNEAIKAVFDIKDIQAYRTSLLHGDNALGNRVVKFKKGDNVPSFIKSLNVNIPTVKGDPITITHSSSKINKKTVDLQKQQDWLDMLNSKDEVTRKLAFDLMIYSITFGTQRTANDFGRFLPNDFVVSSGLSKYLTGVNFNDVDMSELSKNMVANFKVQYIQHLPKYAKLVAEESIESRTDDSITLKVNVWKKAPHLIEEFNDKTFETTLYKKEKGLLYKKIDLLGKGELTAYNISDAYGKSKSAIVNTEENNVEPTFLEAKQSKKILDGLGFNKGVSGLLTGLSKSATTEAHKALADYYLSKSELLDAFKLEKFDPENPKHHSSGNNLMVKGRVVSENGLILINENAIENKADLEHTILHEVTHAYTVELEKNRALLTPEQSKLFKDLDTMVEYVKKQKGHEKYSYYLSNTREFISGTMSNADFQEYLNSVNYKTSNILEKILEFFKKLVELDVRVNSMLANSMQNIIKIIDSSGKEQLQSIRKEASFGLTVDDIAEAEEIRKECQGLGSSIKSSKFAKLFKE